MRTVLGIYRYPIKGLSAQALPEIALQAGRPFPFDRVFALARRGAAFADFDGDEPRWAKKGSFLMLMLEHGLARVRTHFDIESCELRVFAGGPVVEAEDGVAELLLHVNLATPEGRTRLEAFLHELCPNAPTRPKLLRSRAHHFMDKPDNVMSCINLATLRSLESEWGCSIDPLRFRANFYIDVLGAWEEFAWIGSDIQLGGVLFHVDRRNGRCAATNVNPSTGERDLDIPGALRKSFGHKDLGVYLVARTSGEVALGDPVLLPALESREQECPVSAPLSGPLSAPPVSGIRSLFMCAGCYFVYDEGSGAVGVARGTPFDGIPNDWVCPDCGAEKANFRASSPHTSSGRG